MTLVEYETGEMVKPKVARQIDPGYLKRASSIPQEQVSANLESIAISLHQALDAWRYRNAPHEDVAMCLDALIALWTVVERSPDGY